MNKNAFIGPMFRRLFIPAVISAIGLALSDMADAIVAGRRMGEIGLAAIGISLPLYMVINICMHGLGIGGSVHFAKLLSEGKVVEGVKSFNRVLRMALLFSGAIALAVNLFPAFFLRLMGTTSADGPLYAATLSYVRVIAGGAPLFFLSYILSYYLRNDDAASVASAGFLVGNGVDIALNIVFVILLDWGTAGAAWATLIGLMVTIGCYLPTLLSRGKVLRLSFGAMDMAWRETLGLFRSGFSTSSQYLWQMAFLLIGNHTLLQRLSGEGVAVFDMVQNASYFILYLYDAAIKALLPLASTLYGEKNMPAVRSARRVALASGLAAGGVAIGIVALFPGAVCTVFGLTEPALTATAVRALRIYCIGASFAGVSLILESYYQAVEAEKCAFVVGLLRGCAVLIPATLLLAVFAPGDFWYVFPITEIVSLGLFLLWKRLAYAEKPPIAAERIFSGAIHSRSGDISGLNQAISEFCETHGADMRQEYFVTMAAEEISMAIINGGFANRSDGLIQITVIALEDGQFELHIRDNAVSFDPFSLHSTRLGEDDFDMDAMGMTVIKKQAKYFYYRRYQGFNSLVVRI